MRYFVDDLQAVEPDELDRTVEGITITVSPEKDSMGFDRVEVEGPTPEAVMAYVRQEWGTEDEGWLKEWVEDRIIARVEDSDPGIAGSSSEVVTADYERTILCHLNISVAAGAAFSADGVQSLIDGALQVGLEGNDDAEGLTVEVTLCEEIG